MKWSEAKTRELYVILFDDPYATEDDRQEAKAEIERRKKQRHDRLQYKGKEVYPR